MKLSSLLLAAIGALAAGWGVAGVVQSGTVLSLLTQGDRIKDVTGEGKTMIKLPSESNGTAMVFRTFDRVSYALLLEIRSGVRVGDRLINPQE